MSHRRGAALVSLACMRACMRVIPSRRLTQFYSCVRIHCVRTYTLSASHSNLLAVNFSIPTSKYKKHSPVLPAATFAPTSKAHFASS